MTPPDRCENCDTAGMWAATLVEVDGRWICSPCQEELMLNGEATTDEPKAETKGRSQTQAAILVDLTNDVEFFHDAHSVGYATFPVGNHRETYPLRHRGFRSFLERRFYDAQGKPPAAQAVQDAFGVLEGQARFDGSRHDVHVRLAGDDERICLDLGNDDWQAVEITRAGWHVVADPQHKFRRPKGMEALPHPVSGGNLAQFRALTNFQDRDFPLAIAYMIASLRPTGPFPILASYGEQGSAKSTTQRIVRGTIDPSKASLRAAPRNEHELVIAANNGWMLGFDNASGIAPWFSDALCRIATGGGFSARQLYSDAEEIIFDETRPVMVNGIEEVVTRPDLLDRALIVEHPRIPADSRAPEREIWQAFRAAHAEILGALLDVVVVALRNLPTVELAELPRMADFAEWMVGAEPALGWEPGRFLDTYAGNRESAHTVALDSSPIAKVITAVAEGGFEGTASELLARLTEDVDDFTARQRGWPKSASALSGALRRLAPNMREIGIQIEFERSGKSRTISIRTGRENAVTPVIPVTSTPELTRVDDGDDDVHDANDGDDGDSPTQSHLGAELAA